METMNEKQMEDPNEIMENGLTRAQNEKITKDGEAIGGFIQLIVGIVSIILIMKIFLN
jgi:hypothetical protein